MILVAITSLVPAQADERADKEDEVKKARAALKTLERRLEDQRDHPQRIIEALDEAYETATKEHYERERRRLQAENKEAGKPPLDRGTLLSEIRRAEVKLGDAVNQDRKAADAKALAKLKQQLADGMRVLDAWLETREHKLPLTDYDLRIFRVGQFLSEAERLRADNATLEILIAAARKRLSEKETELARLGPAPRPPPKPGEPVEVADPECRLGPIVLRRPREDELGALTCSSSYPGQVNFEVRVQAEDLKAGAHCVQLDFEGVGQRYLWVYAPAGATELIFKGPVPFPPGKQKVTISVPGHVEAGSHIVEAVRVNLRHAERERWIQKRSLELGRLGGKLENPDPRSVRHYGGMAEYRKHISLEMATVYYGLAGTQAVNDAYDKALQELKSAEGLLARAGKLHAPASAGTSWNTLNLADILKLRARLGLLLDEPGVVREARVALVGHLVASAAQQPSSKGWDKVLYGRAGESAVRFAEELLVLGAVGADDARRLWDLAVPYFRKAGRERVVHPAWYPTPDRR